MDYQKSIKAMLGVGVPIHRYEYKLVLYARWPELCALGVAMGELLASDLEKRTLFIETLEEPLEKPEEGWARQCRLQDFNFSCDKLVLRRPETPDCSGPSKICVNAGVVSWWITKECHREFLESLRILVKIREEFKRPQSHWDDQMLFWQDREDFPGPEVMLHIDGLMKDPSLSALEVAVDLASLKKASLENLPPPLKET